MAWGDQTKKQITEGLEELRELLIKPGKVESFLDYGCGRSQYRDFIQSVYSPDHYTGVDIVDIVIEQNKKDYPADRFYLLGDKNDLRENYDVIWCHSVLQHLSDDEATELIYYFSGRLRGRDGILVLVNCSDTAQGSSVLKVRTSEEYCAILRRALFDRVQVNKIGKCQEMIQCQW